MVKTYLDVNEIRRLEEAADNLRDRLLVRVLSRLGCRVSEALGMATEGIDLEGGLVTIEHLKVRLRLSCPSCSAPLARRTVFCPKCGVRVEEAVAKGLEHRRQRTLPVDTDTLAMMREFTERGDPVLRNGRHMLFGISRHRGWQIVSSCADQAGLPNLVNPDTGKMHLLQQHLGHSSFNTTARYRKVSGEEHRSWHSQLWDYEEDDKPED
jgi:integrase/recombinase XerD